MFKRSIGFKLARSKGNRLLQGATSDRLRAGNGVWRAVQAVGTPKAAHPKKGHVYAGLRQGQAPRPKQRVRANGDIVRGVNMVGKV